jgi:hypothetical protein
MVETRSSSRTTSDTRGREAQVKLEAPWKTSSEEKDQLPKKHKGDNSGSGKGNEDEASLFDDNKETEPLPSIETPDKGIEGPRTVPQKRGFEELSEEGTGISRVNMAIKHTIF